MVERYYTRELIMLIAHFCGRVLATYAWQALTSNTLLLVNVTPKERFNYKVLEASKKRGSSQWMSLKIRIRSESNQRNEFFICYSNGIIFLSIILLFLPSNRFVIATFL